MNEMNAGAPNAPAPAEMSSPPRDKLKSSAKGSFAPNPLVAREWRARWRDKRSFLLVLVYVSLLAVTAAWYYQDAIRVITTAPARLYGLYIPPMYARGTNLNIAREFQVGDMARVGHMVFLALSWCQTLAWMVLAPTLTSSALAGERERGLLEGLQLSRLSAWQIVGGKLSSALIFAFVLMIATWPIVAVCFLMGGVSPQELALSIGLQSVTAFACASLGLFFSARCRRAGTALRACLITMTLWGVGSYIAYAATEGGTTTVNFWSSLLHIYGKTNPVVAALSIGDPMGMARGLGLGSSFGGFRTSPFIVRPVPTMVSTWVTVAPYIISSIFQLALIPILLFFATRALRKPFPEQHWIERESPRMSTHAAAQASHSESSGAAPQAKRIGGSEPWWEIPLARWVHFSNPVLQREVRGKFRMRRVSRAVIVFEIVLALFVGGFGCWAVWLALFQPDSRGTIWMVLSLTGLVMVMMTAPMIGASAWSHERESGTFEPLMLSLLPSRDIIWGKMAGALLACAAFGLPMYPLLALCIRGAWYQGFGTKGISLSQAGASALLLAATTWCYCALGMLISWRHNRSATAAGWTMSIILMLNMVLPWVLSRLGSEGAQLAAIVGPVGALWRIIADPPPLDSNGFEWIATSFLLFGCGLLFLAVLHHAMRRRATQAR